MNLVYVTHATHDFQLTHALDSLNYFPEHGPWDKIEPLSFNTSLRFEVLAKDKYAGDDSEVEMRIRVKLDDNLIAERTLTEFIEKLRKHFDVDLNGICD